jgi:hypothetical protein
MPSLIVNEQYNGAGSLSANAGDWIDGEVNFQVRFSRGSGTSNKITWNVVGSSFYFYSQAGDWGDEGFLAGDSITVSYTFYALPSPFQAQSFTFNILYISGQEMYVDTPFGINFFGSPFTHINGRQFPTESYVSGILIVADRAPSTVDFEFNLTPNGSTLLNSMIDSEINKFRLDVVTGIPTGVPQAMTQLANLSGGLIKDVDITLTATPGEGWRNYRIRYKFLQWGLLQDGIEPPNYYDTTDCLAPVCRITSYAEYGNPNGVLIDTSTNVEANTGFFDENYNGVLSLYSNNSTSWVDFFNNPIDRLNYSGLSSFTSVISAPNQVNPTSTYRIGLAWRPIDGNYYQNKILTNVGQNLLVNAPEIDFIADGTTDPTIYQGLADENGAKWDFQNLKFEITGANEITVSGDIIPNGLASTLFAGVPDGGRKSTLWVSIGDIGIDGTPLSKRVSLRLFDDDNYDAPILGVQIPNIVDEILLDHDQNDITIPLPQTTTEDDVLYRSNFQLINGLPYEGIRANIQAFNTATDESFTLEEIFFSFNSVPQIAGVFEANFLTPRGFNLPPTSDRNHISLVRNPANDAVGLYGLTLEYGYLSRWEYWLSQSNVDDDFFDISMMFNGKNKDWQRFSNSGDWIVRLAFFTRLDGVDDFNYQEIGIRPYEDDINVSTAWGVEVLSSGVTPTSLVNNELHEITATLTWAIGSYTNAWAEMTIEDFESGNRWVISSVLAHGGIAQNPLKPIAGQTMLDLQLPSANVAVLKAYLDTNVVSANKVCVSSRIYSEDEPLPPEWEWLLSATKEALVAYSDARRLGAYYTGDLIRVRRHSDNAELDIPYIQIGVEWVLDEVVLLNFVGTSTQANAWVVTRYNQGIPGTLNAVQSSMSSQPPIVVNGVVLKDPVSNRPAHFSDGIQMYHDISNSGIQLETKFLGFSVFSDLSSALTSRFRVGIGHLGLSQPANLTWAISPTVNELYSDYTNPSISHFIGDQINAGFIVLTWGEVNGITSYQVEGLKNGIYGTTGVQNQFTGDARLVTVDAHSKGFFHDGYKSEDAQYGTNGFQTEAWISNNINNFYQIY